MLSNTRPKILSPDTTYDRAFCATLAAFITYTITMAVHAEPDLDIFLVWVSVLMNLVFIGICYFGVFWYRWHVCVLLTVVFLVPPGLVLCNVAYFVGISILLTTVPLYTCLLVVLLLQALNSKWCDL